MPPPPSSQKSPATRHPSQDECACAVLTHAGSRGSLDFAVPRMPCANFGTSTLVGQSTSELRLQKPPLTEEGAGDPFESPRLRREGFLCPDEMRVVYIYLFIDLHLCLCSRAGRLGGQCTARHTTTTLYDPDRIIETHLIRNFPFRARFQLTGLNSFFVRCFNIAGFQ